MARVKHRVGIYGGIGQVFLALKASEGFAGLWVSSAEVNAKIDGKADLMLESLTGLKFKYKDIQENERAAIQCVEGPGRWTGSEILFELENADDQVFVTLTHQNEASSEEEFLYFSTKRTCYLQSLKGFIETGKGRPYPNDIKILVGDQYTY